MGSEESQIWFGNLIEVLCGRDDDDLAVYECMKKRSIEGVIQ